MPAWRRLLVNCTVTSLSEAANWELVWEADLIERPDAAAREMGLQSLRAHANEVRALTADRPSSIAYTISHYAFDEIGRTICAIVDRCVFIRSSELFNTLSGLEFVHDRLLDGLYRRDTPDFDDATVRDYVDMGFDQVNVCLHLKRWVDGTVLPTRIELAERGWHAVRSFKPGSMLSQWRLIDLDTDCPEDAKEAVRHLTLERPDFHEAYAGVAVYACLEGAPSPPSGTQESHYDRLFGYLCTLTEIAVSLMHRVVNQRKARERLGIITSLSDFEPPPLLTADDDDRPKSDAEAAALTRRQSGIELWDGMDKDGREKWMKATPETPLLPAGLHGSIERAIYGHNGRDSMLALGADDPTVCLIKRRAKVQDWFKQALGDGQIRQRAAGVGFSRDIQCGCVRKPPGVGVKHSGGCVLVQHA